MHCGCFWTVVTLALVSAGTTTAQQPRVVRVLPPAQPHVVVQSHVESGFILSADRKIPTLEEVMAETLPRLGHNNWIVVADAAYPSRIMPGLRTLVVDMDPVDVLKIVLQMVEDAPHVRPIVYLDRELLFVSEKHAPGIERVRGQILTAIGEKTVMKRPHEQTTAALDEAAQTFEALLIKTKMRLPYTSVFIQLERSDWLAEAEAEMRATMKAAE